MTKEGVMTLRAQRPPYDPELAEVLAEQFPDGLPGPSLERLAELRTESEEHQVRAIAAERGLRVRDLLIDGHRGDRIGLTVIDRERPGASRPCFFYLHGGGMIMGDRWSNLVSVLPWIDRHEATVVTVEYRLAPEFPDPYPVEDCFSGLRWVHENAADLGIDPESIVIAGTSAGGGLAAGTALLSRDRSGPMLIAQILMCPMLDDRDQTASTLQYSGTGGWDRKSNRMGWLALLGERRNHADTSIYASPARADDLSGLPPAFIDCGSAEVFRDEDVAYASALWQAGVQVELHVWAGGFHCFDLAVPGAAISGGTIAARDNWIERILGGNRDRMTVGRSTSA
jgi:acetyl esterase/lipase